MTRATTQAECAACVASRRSVVEAFLLGFRAAMRESFSYDEPTFCTAHELMVTEVFAEELRAIARRDDDATG